MEATKIQQFIDYTVDFTDLATFGLLEAYFPKIDVDSTNAVES
jgi:hypothetical protein